MTQEMNKNYSPKDIEQSNYENWESSGKFACNNTNSDETYSIMR